MSYIYVFLAFNSIIMHSHENRLLYYSQKYSYNYIKLSLDHKLAPNMTCTRSATLNCVTIPPPITPIFLARYHIFPIPTLPLLCYIFNDLSTHPKAILDLPAYLFFLHTFPYSPTPRGLHFAGHSAAGLQLTMRITSRAVIT